MGSEPHQPHLDLTALDLGAPAAERDILKGTARAGRAKRTHVVELAPEDYSYELLRETMLAESDGSWAKLGAYAVAWKYLIYVSVMKALAQNADNLSKKGPSGKKIAHYLRDNHAQGQYSKLSSLVSYLKRLEGIKIGPYEAGLKAREQCHLAAADRLHVVTPGALRQHPVPVRGCAEVPGHDRGDHVE
jgi:hypothetical protein